MLVGAGALGAADEVVEVADVLGAGVAKALLGKAVLPDELPFVTGAIGVNDAHGIRCHRSVPKTNNFGDR